MLARWLMAFCVFAGLLCLGEDARGFEVLPQSGLTSSTKASEQSGFAGLTLARQSMSNIGDSFRLFDEKSNLLRFRVFEEAGWDVESESVGHAGQGELAPDPHRFSLIPRLFIGAGVYMVASSVIGAVVFLPAIITFIFAAAVGSVAGLAAAIALFVLGTAALVVGISWAVWEVGNRLGGEGSYLATVAGLLLVPVLFGVLQRAFPDASEVLYLPISVLSLFGPVAGYEISSHKRRQRRNYSVGISPVFAPGPAASMRVEGAALAIRGAF
jgi:hypothetical protein